MHKKKKQTISNCASSDIMQMFVTWIKVLYYLWPKYRYVIYSPSYWIVAAIFATCLTTLFLMSIINFRCMPSRTVQMTNLLPHCLLTPPSLLIFHCYYQLKAVPISLAVKINAKKLHIFSSISSSLFTTLYRLSSHQTSPISFTGFLIQVHLSDPVVPGFRPYAICYGKSILILFFSRSYSNLYSCLLTLSASNF